MIDSMRRAASTALLVAAICGPSTPAAETLKLPASTARAFQEFDDGVARLGKARAALAAIEGGERPRGAPADWSGLVASFEAAAASLKESEGPALPDAGSFSFPQDQLRDCTTRPQAIDKVERQVKALQGVAQRGAETRSLLRERLGGAQSAGEALRALVKVAAKLPPESLKEHFPWAWSDLDGAAAGSVASYAAELRRQQERLDRAVAELRARASAGAALVSTFSESKDCMLAGSWIGSRSQGGAVIGLTVRLVASGSSWTGTANYEGQDVPIRSVTVNGSSLSISLAGGKASLHGTMSGDGRTLRGTFDSVDGPASFMLRRQ